jgi:phage gpG-like protein
MKEFRDLREFERFLANVISKHEMHREATLEAAATYIEDEAKRKFGVYQNAVGPYPAWPELADSTKEDREERGYEPNNPLYRSGDLMHSITHKVEGDTAIIGSDSDVMVYQELGVPASNLPARPVLGPAAFQSKAKVLALIEKGTEAWLGNKGALNKKSIYSK